MKRLRVDAGRFAKRVSAGGRFSPTLEQVRAMPSWDAETDTVEVPPGTIEVGFAAENLRDAFVKAFEPILLPPLRLLDKAVTKFAAKREP